jgi:hypothetical protein
MTPEENVEILRQFLVELRLLRESVNRIADLLEKPAKPRASAPKEPPLTREASRTLYIAIRDEYVKHRKTDLLDQLLDRSRADIELFCSENNLPINLRSGRTSIRDGIMARLREEEQLRVVHPMHKQTSSN